MSAPKTDIETQHKRHGGALRGIAAVVVFAALLFGAFLMWTAESGETPVEPETQIDGRTGDEVE
ncbi:hypothetical protein JQU17_04530 [Ponticoccus sp. SC2-23]|uniref:hypothetical protein n=1 Tax=Alexandriicola marinus TaxID=2081710 RepID=UPI000FD89C41|nr:hypothetical protein [Alexandriicola marinus]MBM1219453.1 hypothetical protein [Ponticoccus sp. SC6-9]MBM1223475.1 hypothetical protein [Ponticoccus sp. SC6-15]MBM1229266.1 hypothetical protein [Ponticoccus sp. SC6-38]MBM1232441.1 hypothetical protein [Ponticoccus sp. SC6-45]MBM1237609.1 hypothetical protein [Ponticoccus sp. SC6-49]MBM1241452.1 hypothetical protein [Ponticoccus sp. SC2-64]MBM1245965.1 hypothetical protein [Ponticoccus sp. SC6-42]MBM1250443.1 hypothetical protein [Pontico